MLKIFSGKDITLVENAFNKFAEDHDIIDVHVSTSACQDFRETVVYYTVATTYQNKK